MGLAMHLIGLTLTLFLGYLLLSAYWLKKDFFPSMVYFAKNKVSVTVLHLEIYYFMYTIGKILVWLFFGSTRPGETERLREKMWYALTDTCFAFTIYNNDPPSSFLFYLGFLLFSKFFHFFADIRTGTIEREPVITFKCFIKNSLIFILLIGLDLFMTFQMSTNTGRKMSNLNFLLMIEYLVLLVCADHCLLKFIANYIDYLSNFSWHNKDTVLSFVNIFKSFAETILYGFFLHRSFFSHNIIPIFFLRPLLSSASAFYRSVTDQINCRKVVKYIEDVCLDVTTEELEASHDNTCVVCREEMTDGKKLPCGHIFHFRCLKSWFQRQQSCPTCRFDLLSVVLQQGPDPQQNRPHERQQNQARPQNNNEPVMNVYQGNAQVRQEAVYFVADGGIGRKKSELDEVESGECPCSTCRIIKSSFFSDSVLPLDPNNFFSSEKSLDNLCSYDAAKKILQNIRMNLEAAQIQLNYYEEQLRPNHENIHPDLLDLAQ